MVSRKTIRVTALGFSPLSDAVVINSFCVFLLAPPPPGIYRTNTNDEGRTHETLYCRAGLPTDYTEINIYK